MNPETIDKIKEVLAPVAQKIGQGAEYGWAAVIKQQYLTASLGLFWLIIGLISLGLLLKLKVYEKCGYGDDPAWVLLAIFGTLGSLSAIVAGGIFALTHFLNPDYYALQFFINLVK